MSWRAREHVVSRRWWVAASMVVTVGVLALASARPKDDVAWLVYVAQRVLHGARLYVDLVEVNPPLIVLLSAMPASLAEWMGLPALPAYYVAAMATLLLCAGMAASLLPGHSPFFADGLRTAAFLVVVLALAPGAEFGQREHLFAALALPYLALVALRLRGGSAGRVQAALVGALGAIGFALKPHFLLVLALLELCAVRRGLRLWRVETAAVALVVSAYALTVVVFFPAYVTDALPLAFAYYRAHAASWRSLLVAARYALVLGAFNLALRRRSGRDPLAFVLAVFGVASAVVYVAQWKGWMYQVLPCYVALALRAAYVWATTTPASQRFRRWGYAPLGLSVLVAGLGAVACESLVHASRKQPAVRQLASLVRRDDARSLLVLSRSLSPAFPVVNQTGVRWASRFDTTWALLAESSLARQGDVGAQGRPILRTMAEDFVAGPPDLVAIDATEAFDYVGTLSTLPAFARAWREYREETEGVVGFRVFTRQGPR